MAEGVLVPDRFVTFPDAAGSALAIPPELMFTGGLATLASMIGAARGARDLVAVAVAGSRVPYLTTYARAADSPLGR